jgi:hypothetical protein
MLGQARPRTGLQARPATPPGSLYIAAQALEARAAIVAAPPPSLQGPEPTRKASLIGQHAVLDSDFE